MTGSCFQEEVWGMAAQGVGGSVGEGGPRGQAAQLGPSLSEVHLVEAFFDVEQRLASAAAAAAHPAALPQVHPCPHTCTRGLQYRVLIAWCQAHLPCEGLGAAVTSALWLHFGTDVTAALIDLGSRVTQTVLLVEVTNEGVGHMPRPPLPPTSLPLCCNAQLKNLTTDPCV